MNKEYKHKTYANGFKIKVGVPLVKRKGLSTNLAEAAWRTREQVAAEMFNNAFQDNIPDFMDPMDLQGVINREIERLKNLEA